MEESQCHLRAGPVVEFVLVIYPVSGAGFEILSGTEAELMIISSSYKWTVLSTSFAPQLYWIINHYRQHSDRPRLVLACVRKN